MKKLITVILVIVCTLSALLAFSGCNLLFNDGSADEVPGVYGVSQYFYRDINSVTHNYGGTYEYYLLILNGDGTGKVIVKEVDGNENTYDVTYTTNKASGDDDKIASITVDGFHAPAHTLNGSGDVIRSTETPASFEFKPKLEKLVFRKATLRSVEVNGSKTVRTIVNRVDFIKLYNKVSDNNIEKAKQKQINTIEDRKDDATDSDN